MQIVLRIIVWGFGAVAAPLSMTASLPLLSRAQAYAIALQKNVVSTERRLHALISIKAHRVLDNVAHCGATSKLAVGLSRNMPEAISVRKWLEKRMKKNFWCARQDSNLRPTD